MVVEKRISFLLLIDNWFKHTYIQNAMWVCALGCHYLLNTQVRREEERNDVCGVPGQTVGELWKGGHSWWPDQLITGNRYILKSAYREKWQLYTVYLITCFLLSTRIKQGERKTFIFQSTTKVLVSNRKFR